MNKQTFKNYQRRKEIMKEELQKIQDLLFLKDLIEKELESFIEEYQISIEKGRKKNNLVAEVIDEIGVDILLKLKELSFSRRHKYLFLKIEIHLAIAEAFKRRKLSK